MRFKRTIQQFLESSIFRRYMITYVLIFLFPLALIPTTLYSVNNALLTRHICSTQMSMVKQARRALDYEARRYNTIAGMRQGNCRNDARPSCADAGLPLVFLVLSVSHAGSGNIGRLPEWVSARPGTGALHPYSVGRRIFSFLRRLAGIKRAIPKRLGGRGKGNPGGRLPARHLGRAVHGRQQFAPVPGTSRLAIA